MKQIELSLSAAQEKIPVKISDTQALVEILSIYNPLLSFLIWKI